MKFETNALIDRVLQVTPWQDITCQSCVPLQGRLFEGHFPGNPIVPGVLLVEALAQASGYHYMISSDFAKMPYLMTIRGAKFRGFVRPGDALDINARLTHQSEGYLVYKARMKTTAVVADAEIMLRLMPFPNAELERSVRLSVNSARSALHA